ncbi:CAI-1 autoinducer sensor kinase/phosphatase CqsS [Elysia marginata]|uniref:CAI-1 autoinducer sensor kinase/phosphatase CqsS n=1 Tax=Elysia marginata TaxID=1093978 RepID=A0AAV4GF70_9GAST|nr:CAI-1 autoinducer sensor kinase/phosphatase CqsS [Elysia marginata]
MKLPRMEQFETAVFTLHLTVGNETFAEVGKGKRNHPVGWHEATSGGRGVVIASGFYVLLGVEIRSAVTIWVDQNKKLSVVINTDIPRHLS